MNGDRTRTNVDLLGTAWDWVLRLRDEGSSQEDLAEWLRWYEADERHREAFEEMQAFWHEAGRLQEVSADTAANKPATGSRATLAWWSASLAAAATLVLALWTTGWFASLSPSPTVRERQLPDGSVVQLAARSVVDVRYTARERALEMRSGEAFFSVARNPTVPFVVSVGEVRVLAVGTAFNIRRAEQRVVVTVTEGAVDLVRDQQRVRATAGQQLTFDRRDGEIRKSTVNTAHALAWREGRLEYLNEPLAAVIADVNRYYAGRVVIDDEAVGRILFSGTVFTGAADAWVQALPRVFPVQLRTGEDGVSRLVPAQPEIR